MMGEPAAVQGHCPDRLPMTDSVIFCENGEWFFWDEDWLDAHGPYETLGDAYLALEAYAEENL